MPRCFWWWAATSHTCRSGSIGGTSMPTRSRCFSPPCSSSASCSRRPSALPPTFWGGRRSILIALAWGSLVSFLLLWAADGFWQMLLATALLAINWTTITADRDGGGGRHQKRCARLWQGQAVGLAQLHRGEPRLGPPHRYARGRDSSAAAPGGNGADGPWRPFLAA